MKTVTVGEVRPVGTTKKAPRADIQGLRALAVCLVIADHLFHWPSGGFVGVDVFFVISGFLITGILLREYEKTGHISFVNFYRRRARRIVPAATLVIFATILASFLLLPTGRAVATAFDGLWAFLFAGNWNMALVGTDYFQLGLPPSPLQHFWSLSVEEQFYFIWPWMMLGLLAISTRQKWSKRAQRTLLLGFFAFATACSFAWSLSESASNPSFAYFSTFSRAWELGVGALLAVCAPAIADRIPLWCRPAVGWLGLLGILASAFVISSDTPFPGPGAVLPVISTAVIILGGSGSPGRSYNLSLIPLTNRMTTYVGDISYSLYLWHFPIIILLLSILPASSPEYFAYALIAMFGLSALSYHFVECTVRDSGWLEGRRTIHRGRSRRRAALMVRRDVKLASLVALTTFTLLITSLALLPKAPAYSTYRSPVDTALAGSNASNLNSCFGADLTGAAGSPDCDSSVPITVLRPTIDQLKDDTGNAYKCYRGESEDLETCRYGDTSPEAIRVALVGDSHAAMLLPALTEGLDDRGWSLDTFVGFGCQWKDPLNGSCSDAMGQTAAALGKSEPYDIVITTGARWVGGEDAVASAAYSRAWAPVIELGTRVIVVADTPGVSEEALACISRIGFDASSNSCGTPLEIATSEVDPLISAASQNPRTSLIDMTDFYCIDGFCPSVIGGVQVYRDTASHVTATFMRSLAPYLLERIDASLVT